MTAVGYKGLPALVLLDAGVEERDGVICVPYRLADGTINAWHCERRKRRWWEPRGITLTLFGLERVPELCEREHRQVWLFEGESDALCARGEVSEWRGVPVDVLALPGASVWKPSWVEVLKGYSAVYVFGDGDGAGIQMIRKVSESVRHAVRVGMPAGRDVRDVIQNDGIRTFEGMVVEAETNALMFAAIDLSPTISGVQSFLDEVAW